MAGLDERVATLEARAQEQAGQMADLRQVNAETRQELRALREELRADMRSLREEMRADMGSLRDEMRADMGSLRAEMRHLRDDMDQRFDAIDRRFTWLVGIVGTGFLAMIGTVAGAFWSLLQIVQSRTL